MSLLGFLSPLPRTYMLQTGYTVHPSPKWSSGSSIPDDGLRLASLASLKIWPRAEEHCLPPDLSSTEGYL